jgi:hypothetical protein
MTDYPMGFEPDKTLLVPVRLPMVFLKLPSWKGAALDHGFGNKPLVDYEGERMFAELAIRSMAETAGWSARWVCTIRDSLPSPNHRPCEPRYPTARLATANGVHRQPSQPLPRRAHIVLRDQAVSPSGSDLTTRSDPQHDR